MKKPANKKLSFTAQTLRALTSITELKQVAGGARTDITCGCTLQCTTHRDC